MSHVSKRKQPQNPRRENIGSQALSSLTLHLLQLALFLSFFCHTHRRKTQTFLSPPPGERVNGPLILRSEDQSQQGSHVCRIKKKKKTEKGVEAMLTWGDKEYARTGCWIDRKTSEEGQENWRGMKHKPCNSPLEKSKRRT